MAAPTAASPSSPAGDRPPLAGGWAHGLLALAAAWTLLGGLGEIDVWAPDEPRYASVAEELRAAPRGASDRVLLRLNGEPYTQKPPLYYWLAALAGAPSGRVDEWAARLPSALAGLATVAGSAALGRALFGAHAGWWAGACLLAVFRFGHLARRAQLDVLLGAFELAAVAALLALDRGWLPRRRALLLAHGALGLAVLTKGPVGLLPLAVWGLFLLWEGRIGEWRRACPAWAWTLSLGPALAWLAGALALAPPGFFGEAVVENLLGRFFAGTSHARPPTYYLQQLPLDLMPLTLVCLALPAEARRALAGGGPEASAWRLALSWVGLFFVFFSLSAGKRGLYLLPCFPAVALLCGQRVARWIEGGDRVPVALRTGAAALLLGVGGLAVATAAGVLPAPQPGFRPPAALGVAFSVALGAALLAWVGLRRRRPRLAFALALALGVLGLEAALFRVAYPAFDDQKSPRPVAAAAREVAGAGGLVEVFDYRPLVGGIRYYAGAPVAEIPDEEALAERLGSGSGTRTIVLRSRHRSRIEPFGDLTVHGAYRRGRRQLLVVQLHPDRGGGPGAP